MFCLCNFIIIYSTDFAINYINKTNDDPTAIQASAESVKEWGEKYSDTTKLKPKNYQIP